MCFFFLFQKRQQLDTLDESKFEKSCTDHRPATTWSCPCLKSPSSRIKCNERDLQSTTKNHFQSRSSLANLQFSEVTQIVTIDALLSIKRQTNSGALT
ncbi:hypothetical protein pipiens_007365 [Culex pipiens pipiens]|uniref:Uncharacterized protein n=1 Tax=Culex pipiens pipiens TaxID=38569 RepID=A0ABD1DLA1_CULPP